MANKPLEELLSSDHDALTRRLDTHAPTDELVRRMKRRAYRKSVVVGGVAVVGFAIACAQLPALDALASDGMLVVAAAAVTALALGLVAFTLPDLD